MSTLSKSMKFTSWILQIVVAGIFVMAVVPKLTGAAPSKALFEVLGAEPMGRYAVGVAELIAIVLLLVPKTSVIGAVVSLGVISGAILSHILKLGISIDPASLGKPELTEAEGPMMFVMALVVFVASLAILTIRREQLPFVGSRFGSNHR